MVKAIFPGSFDPITFGHLDIIERASRLVDHFTVLVVVNSTKNILFTIDERIAQLRYLTSHIPNIDIVGGEGLTTDFADKINASIIIRGIRGGRDVDYELQLAEAYKKMSSNVETLFISAKPEYSFLSSTVVKEFLKYGANIDFMVHSYVKDKLIEKINSKE